MDKTNAFPDGCCSSSDLVNGASSLQNSVSDDGDRGGGSLPELSKCATHLPIKRGLSRHYAGKSQSFMSLTSARSLEDLMEENPCTKRMKQCSWGLEGGLSPGEQSRSLLTYSSDMVATTRSPFIEMMATSMSSLGKRFHG